MNLKQQLEELESTNKQSIDREGSMRKQFDALEEKLAKISR